jgi:hypothetical protein
MNELNFDRYILESRDFKEIHDSNLVSTMEVKATSYDQFIDIYLSDDTNAMRKIVIEELLVTMRRRKYI